MTPTTTGIATLGDLARHFHRPIWMIRRLFERGFLPAAERVGGYRVVPISDIPMVEAALRAAGYLTADDLPRDTKTLVTK